MNKKRLFSILMVLMLFISMLQIQYPVYAASDADNYIFDISEGNVLVASGTDNGTIKVTYGTEQIVIDNINTEQEITIIGATTDNQIVVDGVYTNITVENMSIDISTQGVAAFDLKNDANVNLTLIGTNMLKSGEKMAGLQVPRGNTLTITDASTGSLEAIGGAKKWA